MDAHINHPKQTLRRQAAEIDIARTDNIRWCMRMNASNSKFSHCKHLTARMDKRWAERYEYEQVKEEYNGL
jgi:hypothetical protein